MTKDKRLYRLTTYFILDTLAKVIHEQQDFTNSIENIIKADGITINFWEQFEEEFCGSIFKQYGVVVKDDEGNWKWSWYKDEEEQL